MRLFKFGLLVFMLSANFSLAQTIARAASGTDSVFVCPPCGDCDYKTYDQAGKCPVCQMTLVKMAMNDFVRQINLKPVTVNFYIQDHAELLDFAGPMEVFSAAGFKVNTISKTRDTLHCGTLSFVPQYTIANAPKADVMVVFGGDYARTVKDTAVIGWIRSQARSTPYLMSVCTGAFILGKADALKGMTATTYFLQIENLQKALPDTKVMANTRFVDNGKVITTAGISAGIDGALHLVEKLRGRSYARSIAQAIEYDQWKPDQGLIVTKGAP